MLIESAAHQTLRIRLAEASKQDPLLADLHAAIDARAEEAKAELHAMATKARRSLGQSRRWRKKVLDTQKG